MSITKAVATVSIIILFCFSMFSQNKTLNSLLDELKTAGEDTNKVNLLYNISKKYLYNIPDTALKYNDTALKLALKLNYRKGVAASYDILGVYFQNKSEYHKADSLYRKSLNIRNELKNQNLIAVSYNNLGVLNRKKGSYSDAEKYFLKALEIYKKSNDTVYLSRVYNNLGLLMENTGKYEKSVEYHLLSLLMREKLGDKQAIASSYNNLGIVYLSLKDYDKAQEYMQKSLAIKKEIGNKNQLQSAYINLGNVKYYQKKYDEALDLYEKSLKISESLGDKRNIAALLSNMSYIALKKGDVNKSVSYNLKSIKILKEIGNIEQLCSSYNSLTNSLYTLKKYDKAYEYALKAKDIATENNILPSLKSSLKYLYKIKFAQKDYILADKYLNEYIAVKDSILNKESNKQILELQTKYETQKKEQAIIKLSKQKEISELKNQKYLYFLYILLILFFASVIIGLLLLRHNKLKAQQQAIELEQRLLRLQMNPHFIFNSLSAIQEYILNSSPIEASSYLSDFAKLMRTILTNSVDNFISLTNEIETVNIYLKLQHLRLSDKFEYNINVSDDIDSDELYVPPMLLQPFIENSIVHGFSNKQKNKMLIEVSFKKDNSFLIIETSDNGIGRQNTGNNKKHKSMSVAITNQRIKLLSEKYNTTIEFNIIDLKTSDNQPAGTLTRFKIPLNLR
jgi:tetratricopeptide (TPR) repeat protein